MAKDEFFGLSSNIYFDIDDFNSVMFLLNQLENLLYCEIDQLISDYTTEVYEIDKVLSHLSLLQSVRSRLQSNFYANREIIDLRLK